MSEGGEGLVDPEHPRALRHRGAEEAGTHTHTHSYQLVQKKGWRNVRSTTECQGPVDEAK